MMQGRPGGMARYEMYAFAFASVMTNGVQEPRRPAAARISPSSQESFPRVAPDWIRDASPTPLPCRLSFNLMIQAGTQRSELSRCSMTSWCARQP